MLAAAVLIANFILTSVFLFLAGAFFKEVAEDGGFEFDRTEFAIAVVMLAVALLAWSYPLSAVIGHINGN